MVILIDESGIHAPTGHSTIALVYIRTSNLQKLEDQVVQIEQGLGIHNFHWAHRSWKIRKGFISSLAQADFKIKLAILYNPVVLDKSMEEVLQHLIIEKHINQVFIDGSKPRRYAHRLKKVLRDKGVSVKKLRTVNDQAVPAMRVADAVAGLCRYYHDKPDSQATKLYKLIEPKIEFIIRI